MNFENIIKETDTYIYKKCQFHHVDFTSAISVLHHFAKAMQTSSCLTKREVDWYLELADRILFEVADSDGIKDLEAKLIDAYKRVYQGYSNYLTKNCEMRYEKNLKEICDVCDL